MKKLTIVLFLCLCSCEDNPGCKYIKMMDSLKVLDRDAFIKDTTIHIEERNIKNGLK